MVGIQDIIRYHFLSGISYSPSGKNAAFIVHDADLKDNGYHSCVWRYDPSGDHRQITRRGKENRFVWLDDSHILVRGEPGEQVAAKIDAGEAWTTFFIVDIFSGEEQPLMEIPLNVIAIERLGDHEYVVAAMHDIHRPDLYSLPPDRRAAEIDARDREKGYLVLEEIPFCKNGVGYVSGIRKRLYIFDSQTREIRPITGRFSDVETFKTCGSRLLYNAVEYTDIRTQSSGLYLYRGDTGETETLLPQGEYVIGYSDFLPDGKFVFIGWQTEKYEYTNNASIFEVTPQGVRLICYPDISLTNAVSSDVRYGENHVQRVHDGFLYTVTTEVTRSVIRRFSLDGQITLLHAVDGSVDDFDIAGDEILFIGQREMKLQELYALKNGREQQVSRINEGLVPANTLGELCHMEFQNGGFDVHYLVLKPANFTPERKYPAVFYIHGGAKVIFGPVFHHEIQMLSSNGYFVIYGDPRGSDGRGTKFARLKGHYGEADYDDMMKAVDTALERFPEIDAGRVACVGGSYGGLTTNMIITRTHRFKCAIALRSISNLISNFSATDNGINFVADQMEATPWVNYDGLWDVSPLKYADKVRTPLLLIHSDLDFRCHYIEAIQMFNALKYHGVESRMVLIEGENHDLSRSGRPRQRIRRLKEILSWLDKHLK